MSIAFLSVPTPHQAHLFKFKNSSPTSPYPSKLLLPLCSPSSTSTPVIEEDPSSSSADELPIPDQSSYTTKQSSGCKACGREEIERGCNGEGRIQGGIATVPGFGWWPIKAYRPCPEFLASGGRYRRQGQSMDEVAFGRGPTSSVAGDSKKPSKKKEGSKK